jgi:hypothetical protein
MVRSWAVEDISFELDSEMTDDPVVTLLVDTPAGRLTFVATLVKAESALLLKGAHIQGSAVNQVGWANLRTMAQALMERMGIDGLVVEGGIRTTGANPGRHPRALRFIRDVQTSDARTPPA